MLTITQPADAALDVIDDSGRTVPIAPYTRVLDGPVHPPTASPPLPVTASLEALLPVHTPELSPGVSRQTVVLAGLQRPLFLMGADPLSLHWLEAQHERLAQLGAIGLAVEVVSILEWRAILSAAAGLTVMPVSGSAIARRLVLRHYPVLITAERIAP